MSKHDDKKPEVVDLTAAIEHHDRAMQRAGLEHTACCPVMHLRRNTTGATSAAYRAGYDQIDWSKRGPAS